MRVLAKVKTYELKLARARICVDQPRERKRAILEMVEVTRPALARDLVA